MKRWGNHLVVCRSGNAANFVGVVRLFVCAIHLLYVILYSNVLLTHTPSSLFLATLFSLFHPLSRFRSILVLLSFVPPFFSFLFSFFNVNNRRFTPSKLFHYFWRWTRPTSKVLKIQHFFQGRKKKRTNVKIIYSD